MRKGKLYLLIIPALALLSCKSASPRVPDRSHVYSKTVARAEGLCELVSAFNGTVSSDIQSLIRAARKYLGAPYKYGGKASDGFDCSGLMCVIFEEQKVSIPRRSADQSLAGDPVDISRVRPGDLLFFKTGGSEKINHVGIVNEINSDGEITFVQSSTSKGVIISSLNEKYWNKAFSHARRIKLK